MSVQTPRTKILFILPGLQMGGAERILITLMNSLPSSAYDKSIAVVNADGPLKSLISSETAFFDLNGRSVLKSMPALYRVWKQQKPDIVMSTMAHMNFATLLLKSFFPRTKVIVREATLPSYFFETYKNLGPLIKCAYRTLYKKADLILAPSDMVLKELRALPGMGNHTYRLLYNPVTITCSLKDVQPSPDTIQFVSIGRLDTQKGFDLLISALAKSPPSFPWQWRIAGEGPQQGELQSQIDRAGLNGQIILEGFQSDTSHYYLQADALLLPSRWEGMPNVALESLAHGTPVIATQRAGGIVEIAALCNGDHVKVLPDMDQLVLAMKNVTPKISGATLLPAAFERETVFADFRTILDQV